MSEKIALFMKRNFVGREIGETVLIVGLNFFSFMQCRQLILKVEPVKII